MNKKLRKSGPENSLRKIFSSGAQVRQQVREITRSFLRHFESLGYKVEKPVKISSGIDDSVVFVGSGISNLKKYFINKAGKLTPDRVPTPGVVTTQRCVRTWNIDSIFDEKFQPHWGSLFINMVLITPPSRFNEASIETLDFFTKKLGLEKKELLFRVNTNDSDLYRPVIEYFDSPQFEKDTKEKDYYIHKLGRKDMQGRSYNLAIKRKEGSEYIDVGNFIFHHDLDGVPVLSEIGFGDSTILKQLCGADHVCDFRPIPGFEDVNKKYKNKFSDVMATSIELLREGLGPFGRDNRRRILKKYMRAISFFRAKCNFNLNYLRKSAERYLQNEFNEENSKVPDRLVELIKEIETRLAEKSRLSKTEKRVYQALRKHKDRCG